MISAGPEKYISIAPYKDYENDPHIRLFISGLAPVYSPIIATKGESETMKELRIQLEELLGVEIYFHDKEKTQTIGG